MTWTIHGKKYDSLDAIRERVAELNAKHPGERFPQLVRDEWHALNSELQEAELASRTAWVAEMAKNPANREAGVSFHTNKSDRTPQNGPLGQARDAALRAVERSGARAAAGDMLDGLIRRDRDGADARYITAHADPAYARAFGRILGRPETAQYEMSPEEASALRTALETRAMSVGTGSAGGYGLPIEIDPSIMLTSDGAINPLRELATVRRITTSEWRGVSSTGVSASFDAEASEVSDDTPTLAQPAIFPEMARAFVPWSFEVGADYPGFAEELGRLFVDAKDVLEADKFMNGAGHASQQPQGLLVGATGTVAAGTASFAVAHVYSTQTALKPRFQPRAVWLSSLTLKNEARRLVASADATEPQMWNDAQTELLGKPWREVSTMPTAKTAGNDIFIYGDIRAGFEIVDRIGMSVELIPHLMGGSGRPTGQRGLLAWWRTSSGVVNQAAIKLLETT